MQETDLGDQRGSNRVIWRVVGSLPKRSVFLDNLTLQNTNNVASYDSFAPFTPNWKSSLWETGQFSRGWT